MDKIIYKEARSRIKFLTLNIKTRKNTVKIPYDLERSVDIILYLYQDEYHCLKDYQAALVVFEL